DLVFGFRSIRDYAKVAFLARGGARVLRKRSGRWYHGPLHPAPPVRPGRALRLTLGGDTVRAAGRTVLRLRPGPGRLGIGLHDGAADFRLR
ncbi:MAG: hypothetical protein ACE5JG_13195, partial [Planctomycetota bacterium]